jgi:hypothetical protein
MWEELIMRKNNNSQIVKSANLIYDAEELAFLLLNDYLDARENPNVKFHILQRKKDLYFLARSMELKLQNWQFYNNENFEVFDVIADAVKRCGNAPEISRLHFAVELNPARKSETLRIIENYLKMERAESCKN